MRKNLEEKKHFIDGNILYITQHHLTVKLIFVPFSYLH
jgi:hypothetical protein